MNCLYLYPILFYIMLNSTFTLLFKEKFGKTIGVCFVFSAFTLFFSQLFLGTYTIGTIFLIVLSILCFLVMLTKNEVKQLFFSEGLLAFVVIGVFVVIMDLGRHFYFYDEFWHWGMMVKESLRLDNFYCIPESRLIIHKDYPPFMCMLEILWTNLIQEYNEGAITTCINLFDISLIIPPIIEMINEKYMSGRIISGKERLVKYYVKNIIYIIALIFILLTIVISLDQKHVAVSLLADVPLGLLLGYSFFLVISKNVYESVFGLITLMSSLCALVMIKQVGIPYALVVVLLFCLIGFFNTKESKERKKVLQKSAILTLVPLLLCFLWSSYIKALGVTDIRSVNGSSGQFSLSKINISEYVGALTYRYPGIYRDVLYKFFRALFFTDISGGLFLSISYFTASIIVILLILFLTTKFNYVYTRNDALCTAIAYSVGTIGYAFMLSVLFLFCFTDDEMIELRGFERYVDSYIMGEIVSLLMLYIFFRNKNDVVNFKRIIGIALISIVVMGNTNILYIAPQFIREDAKAKYYNYANRILTSTDEDESICLIYDYKEYGKWWHDIHPYIYYYANERTIDWGIDLFNANTNDENIAIQAYNTLSKNDYVYVININDKVKSFLDKYKDDSFDFTEDTIYKIEKDKTTGDIKLTEAW